MFDHFRLSAIVHSTVCHLLGLEYRDSLMTLVVTVRPKHTIKMAAAIVHS